MTGKEPKPDNMKTRESAILSLVALAIVAVCLEFTSHLKRSEAETVPPQGLAKARQIDREPIKTAVKDFPRSTAGDRTEKTPPKSKLPRSIWTPDNSLNLAYFNKRGVSDSDLEKIKEAFIALKFNIINIEIKSAKISPGSDDSVIIEVPRYESEGSDLYDGFLTEVNSILAQSNSAEISRREAYGLFGELPNLGLQRKKYILKPVSFKANGEIASLEVTAKRYKLFHSSITDEISEIEVYTETESDVTTSDLNRFGISLGSLFQVADSVLRG